MDPEVRERPELRRFEIYSEGHLGGFVQYRLVGPVFDLYHAEVDPPLQGHGLGTELVHQTLEMLAQRHATVRATCPLVKSYLAEHPEYESLLETGRRDS